MNYKELCEKYNEVQDPSECCVKCGFPYGKELMGKEQLCLVCYTKEKGFSR